METIKNMINIWIPKDPKKIEHGTFILKLKLNRFFSLISYHDWKNALTIGIFGINKHQAR